MNGVSLSSAQEIIDETPDVSESCVSNSNDGKPLVPVVMLIDEPTVEEEGSSSSPLQENNSTSLNPQEASAPVSLSVTTLEVEGDVSVVSAEGSSTVATQASPAVSSSPVHKKRRRRRPLRVAAVDEDSIFLSKRQPPRNQYETVLRRRAIRKQENESEGEETPRVPSNNASPASSQHKKIPVSNSERNDDECDDELSENSIRMYDEEFGDISLGMKLNIIGGRVIVQSVKPLEDGRASPAQLSGRVQRGDVLLSVDHVSLVNLALDQLVEGLKPLSSALPDGSYKRSLYLRFAMGEGIKLLEKNEALSKKSEGAKSDPEMEAASDIFSLTQFVPMVDQLSGVPLFEEHHAIMQSPVQAKLISTAVTPKRENVETQIERMSPDQTISINVAKQLQLERKKYLSEFFLWNKEHSELLRATLLVQSHKGENGAKPMTRSQLIQSGQKVMLGAKVMFYSLDELDQRKESRSYKRWSSTLSWASSRRQRDESVCESKEASETSSVSSSDSGDFNGLTGDELLLMLAAQDEIWRKQLLSTLADAAEAVSEHDKHIETTNQSVIENDLDPTISLGKMFLGEQVSSMLKPKKQSHALPPKDTTAVLYDLIMNLSNTPDEISLTGNAKVTTQSKMVPFHQSKYIAAEDNTLLAASFIVKDAIPVWLKSFRPLPWDQRRMLWPKNTSGTHHVSDDGLTTLDSGSTGYTGMTKQRQRKTLQEQIEEMELDAELKSETCALLTFYFTQEILPMTYRGSTRKVDASEKTMSFETDAVAFIEHFGSYLNLYVCLVYAAIAQLETVVQALLSLAKNDMAHRQALKELSKADQFILYDPSLLSALVQKLHEIRTEESYNRRYSLVCLCASAYPDLLPWQLREACCTSSNERPGDAAAADRGTEDLYYEYLSLLLHPSEGHESARHNLELVQEWCELSVKFEPTSKELVSGFSPLSAEDGRSNFRLVASSPSGDQYCRDLPALLRLSMEAREHETALGLIDAILEHERYSSEVAILADVKSAMKTIAMQALGVENFDVPTLKIVFNLYGKLSVIPSQACRESILVANELNDLLLSCSTSNVGESMNERELNLLFLLAREATPEDVMQTMTLWTPRFPSSRDTMQVLHILVQRGAQSGIKQELSGSLLRVRHARQQLTKSVGVPESMSPTDLLPEGNIWGRMFEGSVTIDK